MQTETLTKIATASFSHPGNVPGMVDRMISRNRSLPSKVRREMVDFIYDVIRWRRRIWGDIVPTYIDWDAVSKMVQEAKKLKENPPLAKWSGYDPDRLARELSFPTWMIDRWIKKFEFIDTVHFALALNQPAQVVLRVNALKKTRNELKKSLDREGIKTDTGILTPWSLYLLTRKNLQALPAFKRGYFEVQDEGSQTAVYLSSAAPGQFVIDACCGAGGKSLALSAMMQNQGELIAVDSDARKFTELKKRMKRAGVKNLKTQWIAQDDSNALSQFQEKADLVLVDPPCTALGTLRRKPWGKWEVTPTHIDKLVSQQKKILNQFAPLVKVGGLLEYITCTINDDENEKMMHQFLEANPSFSQDEPYRILRPDLNGTDGFFIAKLRRK